MRFFIILKLVFFRAELIVIRNEPGPLGIHVVPDYDRLGKDRGLVVQGIEPGGRIDRDGKLAIHDRIIEINGQNLLNMSFQRFVSVISLCKSLNVISHVVLSRFGSDFLKYENKLFFLM